MLLLVQGLQLVAERGHGRRVRIGQLQRRDGVLKRAANQILDGHVVDALRINVSEMLVGIVPELDHAIADRVRRRLKRPKEIKVHRRARERVLEMVHDVLQRRRDEGEFAGVFARTG